MNGLRLQRLCVLAILLIGISQTAQAVSVCKDGSCDHTSIRAALEDNAHNGEDVFVKPGVYKENDLTVGGTSQGGARALTSTQPNSSDVIIDATESGKPVIACLMGGSKLIGLTLRGGTRGVSLCGAGDVLLSNLLVENNSTAGEGGGLNALWGPVDIIDSTFRNNRASRGGAISFGPEKILRVLGSTFINNTATGGDSGRARGGAILGGLYATLLIVNTDFSGNQALGSKTSYGGAISTAKAATLKNCSFTNNLAQGDWLVPGSIGRGGAIYKSNAGLLDLIGGNLTGNQSGQGGGIALSSGSARLRSSATITKNEAMLGGANDGGGIFCPSINSILSLQGTVTGNIVDDISCRPAEGLPSEPTSDNGANNEGSGTTDDPINTFTGELFNQYGPGLSLGGAMPMVFSRYYSSRLITSNIYGSLGDNWRHNHEWTLSRIGTTVTIVNHSGRLIRFIDNGVTWDLNGNIDIAYQLAENAGIYTLLDPQTSLLHNFNSSGQLTQIYDGKGNIHSLEYDTDGLLIKVSDGLGRMLIFTYGVDGKLDNVSDGTRFISFTRLDNNLASVTDVLGNATHYEYTLNGGITTETRAENNIPYTQTWSDGRVITQTNSDGHTTSIDYSGLETTITDPLGHTRVHTHTSTGEFSNRQDQAGLSFSMGSDATGRRNSLTDRLGATTTIVYNIDSGDVEVVTNADGSSYSYDYTARMVGDVTLHDITGATHADASTESFIYDAKGNPISHTDRAGNVSSATFNANGQPLISTNVAAGITTSTYHPDATLATSTNSAGNTMEFSYDELRRLNLVTFADTHTYSLSRDDADNLLTVTDENGNTVTMTYDANNNLVTYEDSMSNTTTLAYDGNDRLLSIVDPLGGEISQTFNSIAKLADITDANGNSTTFGYDALGRQTSLIDPEGHVWTTNFDVEAIITSRTNPLLNTTTFTSDTMGRITRLISPLGHTTDLSYDAMGRISSVTDALNNSTTFTHDTRGLLASISLPGNVINASYTRNELGNITTVTDPGGNNWNWAYDNMGRQTSRTDPLTNIQTSTYDNRNRPASITFPGAMGSLTISYDPAGNVTSSNYSDGTLFNYVYDANNRLVSANGIALDYDANGRITDSNGIAIVRDAGGRITGMTLAPAKAITYTYDANDRVTQLNDWAGGTTTFSYDAAGRLITITRPNGINTTRTYDNDSRLIWLTEGAISSISLTRDAKGQITSAVRDVPQTASAGGLPDSIYAVDAASQLDGATYDAMGRLTIEGSNSYSWNLASQLTSKTTADGTTTATYDAMGQRLSKTTRGVTRSYTWNYALSLTSVTIEQQGGGDLRYYVHTPGGALLYGIDASTNDRHFYHYDEMGNTIFVTDDGGSVVASYAFTPFGSLIAKSGSLDNPFTWQGQYGIMDEGHGHYYIRERYYDAGAGRFISRDSVKGIDPREINPYQYALGNPLRFVDVTGAQSASEEEVRNALAANKKANADLEIAKKQRIAARSSFDQARKAYFAFGKADPVRSSVNIAAAHLYDFDPDTRISVKERDYSDYDKHYDDYDKKRKVYFDADDFYRAALEHAYSAYHHAYRVTTGFSKLGYLEQAKNSADKAILASQESAREAIILHLRDRFFKAQDRLTNAMKSNYNVKGAMDEARQARKALLDAEKEQAERKE
jgi:RHS repeat-associated protein